MKIGDCHKCGKRTMVVLGAEANEVFTISGLCYNCKQTFEHTATINRAKGDNESNT